MVERRDFLRPLFPLLGFLIWSGISELGAQEETADEKQYREDYDRVQKMVALPDPIKRADQLILFLKERPTSKVAEYAQGNYLVVMEDLLKKEDFAQLMKQSERFVRLRPRVGEGYYFYGSALRNASRNDEAMVALAKCSLIRNAAAGRARKYLEVIYKSQNKGSLIGLDKVFKKAQAELGK